MMYAKYHKVSYAAGTECIYQLHCFAFTVLSVSVSDLTSPYIIYNVSHKKVELCFWQELYQMLTDFQNTFSARKRKTFATKV